MPAQQIPNPNTASAAATVTPSDSTAQPVPFRALWVGTGGDVSVQFPDGTNYVFKNVPTGYMLAAGGVRVNSTGTTASNIGAVY